MAAASAMRPPAHNLFPAQELEVREMQHTPLLAQTLDRLNKVCDCRCLRVCVCACVRACARMRVSVNACVSGVVCEGVPNDVPGTALAARGRHLQSCPHL